MIGERYHGLLARKSWVRVLALMKDFCSCEISVKISLVILDLYVMYELHYTFVVI